MSRLVTFGCSNTYGTALPNPGTQAWPSVLARMLGYECVNLAEPASSPRFAAFQIQRFDFESTDIAIISWPEPTRYCFVNTDDTVKHIGVWHHNKEKKWSSFYKELFSNRHAFFDFMLSHDYANMYFASKNILYLDYYSAYTYIDNAPEKYRMELLDYGSDNVHPGVESHKYFAEKIYKDIKEI